jgi:UDP-N-acetylglucosamine 2-epimerase (non-hydrolysing)
MTIFGTRPEIIRLSRVIHHLDPLCRHLLVHTGQNYDPQLSDIFFQELGIRKPDHHLGVQTSEFHRQLGEMLSRLGDVVMAEKPDRVLILGDTNSGLAALVAGRMNIPVFHMEAGNRCYDDRVPEELNRRVIDHCSTVLMPYTHRSKENLIREGIDRERIFVTGNPINEVLTVFRSRIEASDVMARLDVREQHYFLATLHRAENVDQPERLQDLLEGLEAVGRTHQLPVLVSLHPRTQDKIRRFALQPSGLRLLAPLGFFDFVRLERSARAVLSDSGTVQEECAIFGVPNVTIRDVTERPETIECGSNILSGARPSDIQRALEVAITLSSHWTAPPEYTVENVSRTVVKILLGYASVRRHGAQE